MKKVQRFDSVMLKATIDENGFLNDVPVVARVGVQEYTLPDGSIQREFRPSSEVFSWESLGTYQGKPITLGHNEVNSDNAKKLTVGSCCGRAFQDEYSKVRVPVTIYDKGAIDKAVSKKAAELSVGYTTNDIHEPGFGSNSTGEYILKRDMAEEYIIPADWVEFDVLQTNIVVNHVAMVYKGRAGIAKLNLDSEQEFPYDNDVEIKQDDKDLQMKKIKIDGVEFEVSPEVDAHIKKLDSAVSGHDSAIASAVSAATATVTAERDQLKAKVDGFDALVTEAVNKAKADEKELSDLVIYAGECGVKADGLSSKEIKIAVIKELSGIDASTKDDAYIDASFDFAKSSDKMAAQRTAIHGDGDKKKTDAAEDAIPDPQSRFRK